jgi:ketosteroid isomerase-like protein
MRGGSNEPVEVVLEFYAAVRDRRIEDMLALVDPQVCCYPLARPGQSVYYGPGEMVKRVADLHDQHGDYKVEIGKITGPGSAAASAPGATVAVQATIFPEPGHGRPQPVTTVFTVEDGRITSIESYGSATA